MEGREFPFSHTSDSCSWGVGTRKSLCPEGSESDLANVASSRRASCSGRICLVSVLSPVVEFVSFS